MTPPEGYQGVHAVLSTVEGLKKFVSIKESPYHGLNFCQGTARRDARWIRPGRSTTLIKYFADRKKIFMVHFRNIWGNRLEFAEVAVDEGVVDMARAMKVYRDSGYDGTDPARPHRAGPERPGRRPVHGVRLRLHQRVDQGRQSDGVTRWVAVEADCVRPATPRVAPGAERAPMDGGLIQHLQLPPNRFKAGLTGGSGRRSGCGVRSAATSSRRSSRTRASTGFSSTPSTGRTRCPACCRSCRRCPTGTAEPIVRVAWNDAVLIKRILDTGARSILVPFVQNADEARKAVAATRYPPLGIRGVSVAPRANRFGHVAELPPAGARGDVRARAGGDADGPRGDRSDRGGRRGGRHLHRAERPRGRHGAPRRRHATRRCRRRSPTRAAASGRLARPRAC